ncbi:UbiH/UbiF family hydroxylase [Chitinimonas lacunae]|uniref:UbiH/UbiF family hydroxylase n=1 Tax=Chitinimonas lacunae TaxID=1963018 RepID=A0ABV8MUM4_9NEIS
MSSTRYDIAIVGGGLVGASLALALADGRRRVCLIERQTVTAPPADDSWDARVYAISPGSRAFLARFDGFHIPGSRRAPVLAMDVRGDRGGRIRFDALEMAADELAVIVENRCLLWSLWRRFDERIERLTGVTPTAVWIEPDAATLELDDGSSLSARLLVAADGANSWLRREAGIEFERLSYHQHGVVANFQCERDHGSVARQWFRHDGVLAWLPLPGNRLSMVWSTDDAHAKALLDMPLPMLSSTVADAGCRVLGGLTALAPAQAFPLALGRASATIGPRLALVGDAAHTVHPLAGQGVNLGFGDARELADLLASHDGDPGDPLLLARYARGRAEDVRAMQSVCHGLQRLFGHPSGTAAVLRNLGLRLVDGMGPLKRGLMQQAFR